MGKQFGAVYLILGTCIAAGMLGLPVVAAQDQYYLTVIMLASAWLLMSAGAWCLLHVTIEMPMGANMLSMAHKTLGNKVKVLTWAVYLLLFYSLICAYLSASSDLLLHFFRRLHWMIPRWSATLIAIFILGGIVMNGIRSVDLLNRVLMSSKLIICFLVIISIIPFVHPLDLSIGQTQWHYNAWLIMICSFGYATILPSIRDYLGGNDEQLKRVFYIACGLPIALYLVWIFVVQGTVSHAALVAMNHSANTNSLLMTSLASITHHPAIASLSVIFVSICSVTGFFGVAVGLVDFIADGVNLKNQGKNKIILSLMTFLPPTVVVLFDPAIFIRALSYAGLCCLYILVILPIVMYCVMRNSK